MRRAPAPFRQLDISRAIKGARAAGLDVDNLEIEIDPDTGRIVMRPSPRSEGEASANDFDRILAARHR